MISTCCIRYDLRSEKLTDHESQLDVHHIGGKSCTGKSPFRDLKWDSHSDFGSQYCEDHDSNLGLFDCSERRLSDFVSSLRLIMWVVYCHQSLSC